MVRFLRCFVLAVFAAGLITPVSGASDPIVVEPSAQQALFDKVVRDRARSMADQLHSGSSHGLLVAMAAIEASNDLSPVQIDAVFFDLARQLRALDPGQVDPDVLAYLKSREVRAVRRHEESASYLVPLFDVAGTVRGVENQWAWSEGFEAVSAPGSLSVSSMLERYAAGPEQPFARGLRAALPSASASMLDKLAAGSIDEPLIDHFLPYLWLARQELDALSEWLPVGPTSRVADVLRLAADSLDPDQFLTLGQAMLAHPDPGSRAMTLALLTDHHLARGDWPSDWAGQLWGWVDDPEVRSAAALQLARLGAAERWQANPASAPTDALDSPILERIRAMEQSLASTRGGVR